MINCETVKLFYNEYTCKLVVRNRLANLFREKQYANAKLQLDILQSDFENGKPLQLTRHRRIEPIDTVDLQDAQVLFNSLSQNNNHKVRIEAPKIQVYSNDKEWIQRLAYKLKTCLEFWQPAENNILTTNTVILSRKIPYQFRVTLAARTNVEFSAWCDNNQDKVKIGTKCLKEIRKGGYTQGYYFYVRDEKVLNLLYLIIGNSIARIDKVMYK